MTSSDWYEIFLYVSTVLFTVEYTLRLWSCVEDDRYTHPVCGRYGKRRGMFCFFDSVFLRRLTVFVQVEVDDSANVDH